MRKAPAVLAVSLAAALAAGCSLFGGGGPDPADDHPRLSDGEDRPAVRPGGPGGPGRYSPIQMLLRYDTGRDGKITRAELEAGLKADFAAADTNHDGVLELGEVRAVNDARWKEQGAAASPLVDWNGDGVVDFDEFAGAARSLFAQVDADGDGVLTADELHLGAKAKEKPKAAPPEGPRDGGRDGQGQERGPGGPPSGGPGGN